MNEFTVALPISKEQIDEIVELNKSLKKSKVTQFHSALPDNLPENVGLEHNINSDPNMTFDKFMDLASYGIENGIGFTYLLNGLKGFQMDSIGYRDTYPKLTRLIRTLRDIGCSSLKVTNISVIQYLKTIAPDFKMILSTIAGYKEINQYKNLMLTYPEIREVVMTTDSMKNLTLLKHMQDLGLEVIYMVNEGCIEGCPFRVGHYAFPLGTMKDVDINELNSIEHLSFLGNCSLIRYRNFSEYVIKSNIIYPHQIEEYNKLGIHKFKIAGRLTGRLYDNYQLEFIKDYLKYVDNPELSYSESFMRFNRACSKSAPDYINEKFRDITVGELKQFLPSIDYFKKHGSKCGSECGFECTYCSKKAEEFKKYIKERKTENESFKNS